MMFLLFLSGFIPLSIPRSAGPQNLCALLVQIKFPFDFRSTCINRTLQPRPVSGAIYTIHGHFNNAVFPQAPGRLCGEQVPDFTIHPPHHETDFALPNIRTFNKQN